MFSEFVTCRGTLVGNEPLSYSDSTKGYLLTAIELKVVGDSCQRITLLLLKRKSVRVIVPESCF